MHKFSIILLIICAGFGLNGIDRISTYIPGDIPLPERTRPLQKAEEVEIFIPGIGLFPAGRQLQKASLAGMWKFSGLETKRTSSSRNSTIPTGSRSKYPLIGGPFPITPTTEFSGKAAKPISKGKLINSAPRILIVKATIAILAAMLLPVLNAARDRAKSITCTNNLKNMGTQNLFYADSYDGYLVGVNLPGIGWWTENRAFRTSLGGELWDSDSPLKCREWASTRIVCPKAMRALTPALWGVTGDRASLHYSYGMTPEESANLSAAWKQFGSSLNVLAYKLARIRNASARLMFADSNGVVVQNGGSTLLNTIRRMNDNAESNVVMFRHSRKGNIVMMDGHVEALSEADVRVGSDNNRKLWYGFYE